MIFNFLKNDNRGYSAIVSVILVTTVGLIISTSISSLMISREKIVRGVINSSKSYYAAEAGIEDAILRVIDPSLELPWNVALTVGDSVVNTSMVQDDNTITITSGSSSNDYVRNVEVGLVSNVVGASFSYGLQVGEGGIEFTKNGARVEGNIYSNGSVTGFNGTEVTGSIMVAGVGGTIDGFDVWEDTYSDIILNTEVSGTANYNTDSGGNTFNGGEVTPLDPLPEFAENPIDEDTIDTWKLQAEAGGVFSGDYIIDNEITTLGPIKIDGNLSIEGSSVVSMLGTVWVTGDIILQNKGVLELDDDYGDDSGIVIADGTIALVNNSVVCGSQGWNEGSPRTCNEPDESYIMLVSLASGENAIDINNNSDLLSAILYAPNGEVELANNVQLRSVTAYEIEAINNIEIIYDEGIVNLDFSSGPGGGWSIESWKETF
jgi:hypothetical protein